MKYQHLFFDLDHTLWDFETNSMETIIELFQKYELQNRGVPSFAAFMEKYKVINDDLWDQYRKGKVEKEELRTQRFYRTLLQFEIDDPDMSESFGLDYIKYSPAKTALMPHTHEVLSYLSEKYRLHIITNGFEEVQFKKLQNTGLTNYFIHIITSEKAGSKKPEKKIFEYSLSLSKARRQYSLMIGDNLQMDVVGARRCGIDQVFFNPHKQAHNEKPTYEIHSLDELKKIL